MMISLILCALALSVSCAPMSRDKGNYHMGCHTWPVEPKYYGPPNLLPINTNTGALTKTCKNGKLYTVTVPQ